MALDASIYQNVSASQPVPLQNPMDVAQKAMSMAQLGLQYQQTARQMQQQAAIQGAYMRNTDPTTGQLDKAGVLSELGRTAPMAAQQVGDQFTAQSKAQAEAQAAQVDAHDKLVNHIKPVMDLIANTPDQENKAKLYNFAMNDWKEKGIPTQNMTPTYDEGHFNQVHTIVNAQAEHSKQFLDNQKTQAGTEKDLAEAAKARAETPRAFQGKIDPSMDPAELVRTQVPKDQQQKAFEEVKNAQDIKALAPKIREAFLMGSSRNPMTAAQGQRMFEGLINTTVKDAEGTTRQAAFDSIHKTMTPSGTFASPGENDNRWKTVENYLSSKASAPIAKGSGVDLAKFDSTSPFRIQAQGASGGGSIENSANAAEPKGGGQVRPSAKQSPQDVEAIHWAQQNPKDPRAQRILKLHGVQ